MVERAAPVVGRARRGEFDAGECIGFEQAVEVTLAISEAAPVLQAIYAEDSRRTGIIGSSRVSVCV